MEKHKRTYYIRKGEEHKKISKTEYELLKKLKRLKVPFVIDLLFIEEYEYPDGMRGASLGE